ncbi:hypothetical protein AJ79_07820 [Helicocarpus griseus UAMH5409]|uniref:Uncharacterized protein n=1 Tax=Helicocarpus griseus UAMH5409 TaxID=1447875 RepID=A0A2B7WZ53_9EURO|nr:hypothetical protein AJ79_07820 [Helicocarpus griseus UAMH5409]
MQSMDEGRSSQMGGLEGGQENAHGTLPHSSSNETNSRRYDISTLLDIGRRLGAKTVAPLRHRREESGSRILAEKPINRRRISSTFSMGIEDGVLPSQANGFQHPRRQPVNAPQGHLAQIDAGFARFLKEHASPKHHRVTAGGRIVPMNPQVSPAPEFKLPIRSAEQFEPKKTNGVYPPNRPLETGTEYKGDNEVFQQTGSHADMFRNGSSVPNSTGPPQGLDTGDYYQVPPTVAGPSTEVTSAQRAYPQLHSSILSNLVHGERIEHLAPESTSVSSGVSMPNLDGTDNSGWAPNNAPQYYVPPPLEQALPAPYAAQQGALIGMYPLEQSGLMMAATSQLFPIQAMPFNQSMVQPAQAPNMAMHPTSLPGNMMHSGALEQTTQEFNRLKDQLTNLDRYLALHTWEVDPAAKKILIDQRVDLVVKIDAARTMKEQLESLMESMNPRATGENLSFGYGQVSSDMGGQPASWTSNIGQYANNNCFGNLNLAGGLMVPGMGMPMIQPFNGSFPNQEGLPVASAGPISSLDAWQNSNGSNNGNIPQNNATSADQMADDTCAMYEGGQSSQTSVVRKESEHVDSWEKRKGTAPFELSRVYHEIEQAASRGDPLGPLIEELAMVARDLNVSDFVRNQAQIIRQEQLSRGVDSTGNQLALIPYQGPTTSFGDNANNAHVGMMQPQVVSQEAMRQNYVLHTPQKNHVSLSQATVGIDQGLCNRKVDNKALQSKKGKAKAESIEPEEDEQQAQAAADSAFLRSLEDSNRLRNVFKRQEESPTPARKVVGSEQHNATCGSTNAGNAMGLVSNQQNAARSNDILFGQWKPLGLGGQPQKANTSTAFQNVTAYGMLPRFDGAGDSDGRDPKAATTVVSKSAGGNAAKTELGTGANKNSGEKWYRKAPRQSPNAMDVRAFFALLREQEKEALQKHRNQKESRPFG